MESVEYTLTNTAALNYTLCGGTEDNKSDTASFVIAAYEDSMQTATVNVQKVLEIGDQEYPLNSTYQNIYGAAEFTLYKDKECKEIAYNTEKEPLNDIKVNENGVASFDHVRQGTYYLKETMVPEGFKDAESIKVMVEEKDGKLQVSFGDSGMVSADASYRYINEADTVGILEFTKAGVDGEGNEEEALAGVAFTLTDTAGEKYHATSDQDGKVRFDNLPQGDYILTETGLSQELENKGYVLAEERILITIKANEINTLPAEYSDNTFTNESPKGRIKVVKIDAQTNKGLSGAEFAVYGPYADADAADDAIESISAQDSPADTFVTEEGGQAISGLLTEGYYVLLETKAPANYTAGQPQVIEVVRQTIKTVQVENDPQAEVTFKKLGAEEEGAAAQELAGAEFFIFDSEQKQLYGVKNEEGNYEDVSTDPVGREEVRIVTELDSTNLSTSNSVTLSPGTYYYQEVKAPAPYKPSDSLIEFTVGQVSPVNPDGEWDIMQTVTVTNYLNGGQIKIVKISDDPTETRLNGAVFGVYSSWEAAHAGTEAGLVDTITTGTYVINNKEESGVGYSDADLELGTPYYVKELQAPAGYTKDETVYPVTCTSEQKLVVKQITNKRTLSLIITKKDFSQENKVLEGAMFELCEAQKADDGSWEPKEGAQSVPGTTDENGIVSFSNLKQNTDYVYREKQAPTGYVAENKNWIHVDTGTDDLDGDLQIERTVKNKRLADLCLVKTTFFDTEKGESPAPFPGVTFQLYKGTGEGKTPVEEAKTTDSAGKITWTDLEPGTYTLEETLPEGYYADGGSITYETTVTLNPGDNKEGYQDNITKIPNSAKKGKIEIGKYAALADGKPNLNAPLEGVRFGVYEDSGCSGSPIREIVTGENGIGISGWLDPGTYYLKEIETSSEDYVISDHIYKVVVTENTVSRTATTDEGATNLTEIVNEKKGGFTVKKYGSFAGSDIYEQLSGATFAVYQYDETEDGTFTGDSAPKLDPNPAADRCVVEPYWMVNYTWAVSGLEPGIYWLRETAAPDPTWDKVDDTLIEIMPDGTARYGTLLSEKVDGSWVEWSDPSAALEVALYDESNKPRIRIIKKAENPEELINQAVFNLYVEDEEKGTETVVNGNTVMLSLVEENIGSGTAQDENGTLLDGEAITFKLEPGKTYYIKEVALEGSYNQANFYFDEENCWTIVEIPSDAGGVEYKKTIINYRKQQYPGIKYDAANHSPLENSLVLVFRHKNDAEAMRNILKTDYNEAVSFEARPTQNSKYRLRIEDVLTEDKSDLTETAKSWNLDIDQWAISDEQGKFTFTDLIPNETYYFVEVVAPSGYSLDRDQNGNYAIHEVKIPETVDGQPILEIENQELRLIELEKVSEISGVEYHLTNATFTIYGSKVEDGKTVPDLDNKVGTMHDANNSGHYSSPWLPEGTFFIAETEFPKGFTDAERTELSEQDLNAYGEPAFVKDGKSYDYTEIDDVRYYKVILGRNENNTWFKDHPIYNKAEYGRFAITKVDSKDPSKKVAATFKVEKLQEGGTLVEGPYEVYEPFSEISTTMNDSYTYSNFLEPGIYKLTETSVTGNYTKGAEIYIEVEANKITDGSYYDEMKKIYRPANADVSDVNGELAKPIVITNDPQGRFWIYKIGTWNGGEEKGGTTEPLEGVTFDVYRKTPGNNVFAGDQKEENKVGTLETGPDGYVQSGWLDEGEYWVVETGITGTEDNKNYGKDSYEPEVIVVRSGVTGKNTENVLTVENHHNLGKFQVTKKDSFDGTPLSGAEFEIYTDQTCITKVGEMLYDGNGVYTSPFLEPGENKYWLKEITTPAGYTQNEGKVFGPFTVTEDDLTIIEEPVKNDLDNTLTVVKYEQEGDSQTEEEFTENNTVNGACYALYNNQPDAETATMENPGDYIRKGITANEGQITWTGLPNGTYYLKELEAPAGYILNDDVYTIELNNQNKDGTGERISAYTQNVSDVVLGGFNLEKVVYWDQDNNPDTQDDLIHRSDITFKLYDSDDNELATLTTDENGMIEYRLEAGDYYLIESTPEGDYEIDQDQVSTDSQSTGNYIGADGKIHIRVEQSQINTYFTEGNAVRNETSKGRFYLTKKTYTNNEQSDSMGLEGARYTLEKLVDGKWRYCVNGKPVKETVSGEAYPAESVFTVDNASGYESGLLDTGTYRVTEVTAPKKINNGSEDVTFIVDSEPIEFEIKPRTTVELEQYDGIERTLRIRKTADTLNHNKVLANVTFELFVYDEDQADHKGESKGEQTTNGDGVAEWKDLTPGKYVLEETNAPDGYNPVTKEIELKDSLSYVDVVQEETVINESTHGRIVIKKTDTNGNPLSGAEFTIYNQNNESQGIVEITDDGIGISGLLPKGTYRVVETKAPEGYSLDERLEPLEKEVVVSGNQNPGDNFTGVSPKNVTGYIDLVIFQNKEAADITGFKASIGKNVKLEESVSGFEETAQSDKSLMYEDVTVDFKIFDLTDGQNDLPAEKFVVTDESLAFQSLKMGADAGADSNYSDYKSDEELTAQDYVMNFVRLYKSVNKDGSEVTATVKAKTDGSWQDVKTVELSALEDTEYVRVNLPANATGFQVVYNNVGTCFTAGAIEVNVTLKQRPSDETMPDIRRIVNRAKLEWEDTAKDCNGEPAHNQGTVSAEAAVKFPQYDAKLPALELVNNITNVPDKGRFYGGDNIAYETVGGVTETSVESLELPVMGISLPAYTTLDTSKFEGEGGNGGIRATTVVNGRTLILTFRLSDPITQTDENGGTYYTYALDQFMLDDEPLVLEPGQKITLEYEARIGLDVPETVLTLEAKGYISSAKQLPLSSDNPTGRSYLIVDGSTVVTEENSANADAINTELLENEVDIQGGTLTYLERPVSVQVGRSDSLQVSKAISTDGENWTDHVSVKPADTLYYKLTATNGGEAVKTLRFVDIIPFNGDSQEFRDLNEQAGNYSLKNRSTSLPESTDEHTYENVQLLWVKPDEADGVKATVYYCTEEKWDRDTRLSKSGAEELPMLYSKANAVWEGWTTTAPADLSQVTAVGIEVTFDESRYFESGDVYNVTLAMRAPGYTADEMNDYVDAVIGNTTAIAVVRADDTEDSAMEIMDRINSNEVLADMEITTGSIGDYAFYDSNGNGIQDESERPVRNLPVKLYRKESTVSGGEGEWELYAETTTDGTTGKYLFDGLTCNYRTEESYNDASGFEADPTNPVYYVGGAYYEYKVVFDIPEGYGATLQYAGEDRAADSNINAAGETEAVSLALMVDENGEFVGENNMTLDAGYVTLVNLGDYVWMDANKNGIQDESEAGINGVKVNLYRLDSADDTIEGKEPVATQLTATNGENGKDGYYLFAGLYQGYYVVEFDVTGLKTSGYTSEYGFTITDGGSAGADSDARYVKDGKSTVMYTDVIHLTEDDMTWDAGVTVYSALGGFVFDDQDYDNTQSIYIPLPGTVVELYAVAQDGSVSEDPIATQTVGKDGRYLFDRLEEGRYQIHFQYPENYMSVEAGVGDETHDSEVEFYDDETLNGGFTDVIELPADTADLTHDAGAYLLGALGDYVWVDANKDGIQDEGEQPVEGIIVTLQQRFGEGEWETVGTAVTDKNGFYQFTGLKSSEHYEVEYRVVFDISLLLSITKPEQGNDKAVDSNALYDYVLNLGYPTAPVILGYGQSDMTLDAGIIYDEDLCEIGDFVWYDKNQDGIQDTGEEGVEGIRVLLQYCESGIIWEDDEWRTVAETTTNAEGRYLFAGLPSGYYRVGFAVGDPWTVTLTNIGEDTAVDSNATRNLDGYYFSTGFYMNAGESDMTWDAGIYRIDDKPVITQTVIQQIIQGGQHFVQGVFTGDPKCIAGLVGLLGASAAVMIFILSQRRRKKNYEK